MTNFCVSRIRVWILHPKTRGFISNQNLLYLYQNLLCLKSNNCYPQASKIPLENPTKLNFHAKDFRWINNFHLKRHQIHSRYPIFTFLLTLKPGKMRWSFFLLLYSQYREIIKIALSYFFPILHQHLIIFLSPFHFTCLGLRVSFISWFRKSLTFGFLFFCFYFVSVPFLG